MTGISFTHHRICNIYFMVNKYLTNGYIKMKIMPFSHHWNNAGSSNCLEYITYKGCKVLLWALLQMHPWSGIIMIIIGIKTTVATKQQHQKQKWISSTNNDNDYCVRVHKVSELISYNIPNPCHNSPAQL